jgi:hypothetical protein
VAAIRVYSQGDKRDWSRARQRAYRDAAEETQSEGEKKLGESGKKVD